MCGHFGKIGAEFPAVTDGNCYLPSYGRGLLCIERCIQHLFYLADQVLEKRVGAQKAWLVMQGHRVEGGNNIVNAGYRSGGLRGGKEAVSACYSRWSR